MDINNNIKTIICSHCKTENPDIIICITCGRKLKGERLESNLFFMPASEKILEALDLNRFISGIIAICYLIIATYFIGGEGLFRMLGFLILPMGCIWYGDDVGGYTGSMLSQGISRPSAGSVIIFVGWLLLFLPLFQVSYIYFLTGKR